jgi:hypothetical protein
MRKKFVPSICLAVLGFLTTFGYQNCGGGFSYDPQSGVLSSLGDAAQDNVGPLAMKIYSAGGSLLDATAVLDPAMTYSVKATGADIVNALLVWSIADPNAPGCQLTASGTQNLRALKCTNAGATQLKVEAVWQDGSTTLVTSDRTVGASSATTPGGSTTSDPNRIDVHLAAGTGTQPWNTMAAATLVFVGQVLRIYNDDTIPHRLHTNGSPCIHQPAESAPGAFYDCAIIAAHPVTQADLYDHDAGNAAAFYVNSIDGTAAYNDATRGRCNTCHGAVATSTKKGSSFSAIKNAITNVSAMNGLTITDNEIKAVVYQLSK